MIRGSPLARPRAGLPSTAPWARPAGDDGKLSEQAPAFRMHHHQAAVEQGIAALPFLYPVLQPGRVGQQGRGQLLGQLFDVVQPHVDVLIHVPGDVAGDGMLLGRDQLLHLGAHHRRPQDQADHQADQHQPYAQGGEPELEAVGVEKGGHGGPGRGAFRDQADGLSVSSSS